jgi:hypothetical protein
VPRHALENTPPRPKWNLRFQLMYDISYIIVMYDISYITSDSYKKRAA